MSAMSSLMLLLATMNFLFSDQEKRLLLQIFEIFVPQKFCWPKQTKTIFGSQLKQATEKLLHRFTK